MCADHGPKQESELELKYELMPAWNSCEFKTFLILTTLSFTPAIAAAGIATGSVHSPGGFGAMALSFATIMSAIGGVLLLLSARPNLRWLVAAFTLWSTLAAAGTAPTLAAAVTAYTLGIAALAASSDTIQSFFSASPHAICRCV